MNKLLLTALMGIWAFGAMVQEQIVQTAGDTQLGDFAPEFAEINDKDLFGGNVWNDGQ